MLHGPFGAVAYSTVPVAQPEALIWPTSEGHTLFTITIVGAPGTAMVLMVPVAVAVQPLVAVMVYKMEILPTPLAVNTLPAIVPGPAVTVKVPPLGLPVRVLVPLAQRSAKLEVMVADGGVHTPGTVTTAVEIGLAVTPSKLHKQRVSTDCSGPVWA